MIRLLGVVKEVMMNHPVGGDVCAVFLFFAFIVAIIIIACARSGSDQKSAGRPTRQRKSRTDQYGRIFDPEDD